MNILNIVPYKFNGNSINDGTNYTAKISYLQSIIQQTKEMMTERASNQAIDSGLALTGRYWDVIVTIVAGSVDQLEQWFDTSVVATQQFIVQDKGDSNKQYYVYCRPIMLAFTNNKPPNAVTVRFFAADPVWRAVSGSTSTLTITATGQSNNVTVSGKKFARPVITIAPTSPKSGGVNYNYFRPILIYNPTTRPMQNYPLIVTGAALDISGAHFLASGYDIGVEVDGVVQYRWITGAGTASGKIWANLTLPAHIGPTIAASIAGTGAVATIAFQKNTANLAYLKTLATMTNKVLYIDSEAFVYTAVDIVNYQVTGVTRAQFYTSMGAHSAAAVAHHIPHTVTLFYGYASATAPYTDDTQKPHLDLTNSTNTSWVWSTFFDSTAPTRPGTWSYAIIKATGDQVTTYTATQNALANPATVMGSRVASYLLSGVWRAGTGQVAWSFYDPSGMTTATWTGSKYTSDGKWFSSAFLQVGNGNPPTAWKNISTTEAVGTNASWVSLSSHSGVALGATYQNVRFYVSGSCGSASTSEIDYEISGVTMAKDSSTVPQIAMQAEQSTYSLSCTLTNTTTGDAITINKQMATTATIIIDCDKKLVTYQDSTNINASINAFGALALSSTRQDWFNLYNGTNAVKYDDTGTQGVTVTITWNDRSM